MGGWMNDGWVNEWMMGGWMNDWWMNDGWIDEVLKLQLTYWLLKVREDTQMFNLDVMDDDDDGDDDVWIKLNT